MVIYLRNYTRNWPEGPVLEHVNWIKGKRAGFEHVFVHYCAMVMLKGGGTVVSEDGEFQVQPPFVLLARPGRWYRYGPDSSWDEYGFVFRDDPGPGSLEIFPTAPWSIRSEEEVLEQLSRLENLLGNPAVPGVADQLDLTVRLLLTASYFGTGRDIPAGQVRRLYAAESWLRRHFRESIDLGDFARRFGFSEPTFRRLWRRQFSLSPWQQVLELRFNEAQRLLREDSNLSIGEIAYRCGFNDQRYFSTLFKRRVGVTPKAFRSEQGALPQESKGLAPGLMTPH